MNEQDFRKLKVQMDLIEARVDNLETRLLYLQKTINELSQIFREIRDVQEILMIGGNYES